MTSLEIELLDTLMQAAKSIQWALSYCEDGKMPMAGVNSLRRDLQDLKDTIDSRYGNLIKRGDL